MSANEAPKTADDVYKGKEVLKQDKPQRTQAERYEKQKAVREYNKQQRKRYEKELAEYEAKKQKYESDLAAYQQAQKEYNQKVADFNENFQSKYGITYADFEKQQKRSEQLKKQEQEKINKIRTELQEIESAKQKAINEFPYYYTERQRVQIGSQQTFDRHGNEIYVPIYEYQDVQRKYDRAQRNVKINEIAQKFNTDIKGKELEIKSISQISALEQSNYPDWVKTKISRTWNPTEYPKKSAIELADALYTSKQAEAQRNRELSVRHAYADANKAALDYAKNLGAYTSSIQQFEDAKKPDPFIMDNPSDEFKERIDAIKPTEPKPISTVYGKSLTKAQNRPTYTGVKFETIEVQKPQKITQKGYEQIDAINKFLDQYKSTTPLSEGLLTGIVEDKTGQKPYIATQLIIKDLTQQPKPERIVRQSIITDPKTGEKFDTKTGIGSFKIGAALGYQYDQNLQRPVAVTTTESGEIEVPTMYSSTGQPIPKKQTIGDRGLDLALGKVDQWQAIRPETPFGKIAEFQYGIPLGIGKEALSTVATLKNFYETKVKTINFRGDADPLPTGRAPTLKEVGKYFTQKIQFDKPRTDEITVPPTLFSTTTDPFFDRGLEGGYEIPFSIRDYAKKYGVYSTLGEGVAIAAGTGIDEGAKTVGKFIAKKAEPLVAKGKNLFTKPIDSKLQSEFVKGLESKKIKTSISGEVVKTTYKFEEPKLIPVKTTKISTGAPTPVNWTVEKRADLITSRADAIPPVSKGEFDKPLRVGRAPTLQKIGTYKEPVIKVPKGVDVSYKTSTGKPPVSIDWTPEDVARIQPPTGKAPVQPKGFDVSLPDKAGKIPKVVPNTPIVNVKGSPVSIDYSPESLNMFKPKTGSAPTPTPKTVGSELRPTPTTGRAPTIQKIGTYKEPAIKVPKGVDVSYKVSTQRPPINVKWDSSTVPTTRLDELPVFKEVTPPTPTTGRAPRLDVRKQKPLQPTYEYSQLNVIPRSGRVKNVESLTGITPKELQPKQTPKFTIREALPKGLESYSITKTRRPVSVDYSQWNIPAKVPPTGKAPVSVFRYSSTDLSRSIPKVRGQPEIKPIDTTPKSKAVDFDPLFVKTKGRVEVPKGVEPLKYFKSTELNIGSGKTNSEILSFFRSPVKPTKPVRQPKVFKKTQPKPEPQKTKSDYPEEIKSKSGMVTVMKKPTVQQPRQKTKLSTKEPEIKPTRTLTGAKVQPRSTPKTGKAPVLFVPFSKESKKKRTYLDSQKQTYSDTVTVYELETVRTPAKSKTFEKFSRQPITKVSTTPQQRTGYISKSFSVLSSKPKLSTRPQEKTKQTPFQSSRSKQQVVPRIQSKQKPKQKQRLAARSPTKTPTKTRTITITKRVQRSDIGRGFANEPTGRKRKVGVFDEKRDPKKSNKDKGKKGKLFLGNVSEYSIIGTYNRSDIIRNKKKIAKETRKDTKLFKTKKYKVKIA